MNQEQFEEYKHERLIEVSDKAKDIEVALRVHKDWADINASKLLITKMRDKVNEMWALYFNIEEMELNVKEDEEPEKVQTFTYNSYEDEDNNDGYGNDNGYDNTSDYLG